MMDRNTPEVRRVRDNLIRWLSHYESLEQKPLVSDTLDQILSIRGIAVLSDDQSLPKGVGLCTSCLDSDKILKANFRRMYE